MGKPRQTLLRPQNNGHEGCLTPVRDPRRHATAERSAEEHVFRGRPLPAVERTRHAVGNTSLGTASHLIMLLIRNATAVLMAESTPKTRAPAASEALKKPGTPLEGDEIVHLHLGDTSRKSARPLFIAASGATTCAALHVRNTQILATLSNIRHS